ncbi:hypothetical protein YC2023_074512 [Brassica napus]
MEITPFSIRFKLYDQLELLEFPNKFFIKPVDSHHQGFSVDRRDGNIKPLDECEEVDLYLQAVIGQLSNRRRFEVAMLVFMLRRENEIDLLEVICISWKIKTLFIDQGFMPFME